MNSGSGLPAVPALRATTRPLAEVPDDLLGFADPEEPLVWLRGDRGCVGIGEILRLVFTGPDRFAAAARAWRDLAATAEVDDPIRLPGTGLLAFGAFAFADDSRAESVLVVPRTIVSRHRGTAWTTEVRIIGSAAEREAPAPARPRALGSWTGLSLPVTEPDGDYLAGVRAAAARIERGDAVSAEERIEKAVLSRRVIGRIGADDDLRVPLARLAARYDDCWTFAVDGFVGASPETLIRQTGGAVSARVLAGTRGRTPEDPAADAHAREQLLRSPKEQHEHAFAVQSVVTALAPHVGELRTSEQPFALELPNVWHLATDLRALPSAGGSCLDLVAALHPTAAVAGTPTAAAVRTISELEPFDRRRYAGAVGWIDAAGDGEWVIGLRCAEVGAAGEVGEASESDAAGEPGAGGRTVVAYAGGGIVAGSDPEREFAETVAKFAPIAEAFRAE